MTQTTHQTIIFLHIPKTAGTTLNQVIDRQYPAKQVYSFGPVAQESLEAYKQMPEVERTRFRVVRGHMGFGFHQWVPGAATYFTILRDPIDRVISFYYFVQRTRQHYLYNYLEFDGMDLKDLVESHVTTMVDNGQTRMISGVWLDARFGECDETTLEQAKRNLREHFSVVGLTEQFDESLILLQQAFGWKNITYTRQNVTRKRPKRSQLSSGTIDVLRAANHLDIELYDYAKTLFEAQKAAQGQAFDKALRTLRRQNRRRASTLNKWYWQVRRISVRTLLKEGLRKLKTTKA